MLANSPILPVLLEVPMAIALTSISNPLATSSTPGNSTTNFKLMIPVQTLSGQFHSDPTTPFIYLVLANLKPYHLGRSLRNSTIVCPYFSIIKPHLPHP
ncbi:hypothetical protein PPACK8108_LOCUS6631 [Phakopsora pachyrhizi]|uniref:Secreted protein n=1 Tax=Phakopsora pachyrhizi TaxID=170000 RepID=A0AAV0ARB7_PHAPC|nr:hypothetical protein PPACK8108_LOCUS6631 [Phakopsora pachyrhizi]